MQIPEVFRRCVAYLYFDKRGKGETIAGTAFFVAIPGSSEDELPFIYCVTAHHVLEEIHHWSTDDMVHIRLNKHDGTSTLAYSTIDQWIKHADGKVDAAVLPMAPSVGQIDYSVISITSALTDALVEEHEVGPGDEVFVTGLFRHHYGKTRNIPIVRIGAVAQMREEDIADGTPYEPVDGYLIEARSTGGLSGSPVFLYVSYPRWISDELVSLDYRSRGGRSDSIFWMGLVHAHFDEQKGTSDAINSGIAIVVPADRILEILESPEAVSRRIP